MIVLADWAFHTSFPRKASGLFVGIGDWFWFVRLLQGRADDVIAVLPGVRPEVARYPLHVSV